MNEAEARVVLRFGWCKGVTGFAGDPEGDVWVTLGRREIEGTFTTERELRTEASLFRRGLPAWLLDAMEEARLCSLFWR